MQPVGCRFRDSELAKDPESVNSLIERLLWLLNLTGLVWTSWESSFIKFLLLQFWEIFTFRSPGGVQIQSGLGAFFRLSRESRSLLPGVWRHKGWLAGPDRGLSCEVEESLFEGVFSNRWSVQLSKCFAYGLPLPGVHCEKIALTECD